MKRLHVAVGVLRNARQQVLISLRPEGVHMGGLWEFPGGKLEAAETPVQALRRELREELGVIVEEARPLIRIHHDYPNKDVLLDVWEIMSWQGEPRGLEGQRVEWEAQQRLHRRDFPEANQPIIQALELPGWYPIIDESLGGPEILLRQVQHCIEAGYRMMQLRAKSWSPSEIEHLVSSTLKLCRGHDVRVLVNSDITTARSLGADGVHLSSQALMASNHHGEVADFLIAASCHDLAELRQAQRIGANFAVLSPIRQTASHPQSSPIGWANFSTLVERVNLPVYGLGGLARADFAQARASGGQGIAGIRMFAGS